MKLKFRICEKCKKSYQPINGNQRFCQNPCTLRVKKLTIEEANKAWLSRKEDGRKRSRLVDLRFINGGWSY